MAFPDHFGAVIVGALKWALVTGLVRVVVELLGKGWEVRVLSMALWELSMFVAGSEEGGAVIVH